MSEEYEEAVKKVLKKGIDRGYIGDEGVSYELYLDVIGLNFCGSCVHFRTLSEEDFEREDVKKEVFETSKNLTEAVWIVFNYAGICEKEDCLVWYSEPGGEECRFYEYEKSW